MAAQKTYIRAITALINRSADVEVTKIEGRLKDKDECIKKFQLKYQNKLEVDETPYEIKDYITDLIGIRIVCLYEDQIAVVAELLKSHFKIIDVSDKISAIESTEDLLGYKGLHMDLAPRETITSLTKYQESANPSFEVQIRSLIQDAWSVLDHRIKYKKSIPIDLKRRINILSALFEMADREFKEIRNATMELIQQATVSPVGDAFENNNEATQQTSPEIGGKPINAFSFLRVAGHFFKDFEFEDDKVDNFVQDILRLDNNFKKSNLHKCLIQNLKNIKDYRDEFVKTNPENSFSPYTSIRHCLYLYDQKTFALMLSRKPRDRFEYWISKETQIMT